MNVWNELNVHKNRHDCVKKCIDLKHNKQIEFDHAQQWQIHKSEIVLEFKDENATKLWSSNGSFNPYQETRPNHYKQRHLSNNWCLRFSKVQRKVERKCKS